MMNDSKDAVKQISNKTVLSSRILNSAFKCRKYLQLSKEMCQYFLKHTVLWLLNAFTLFDPLPVLTFGNFLFDRSLPKRQ